MPNYCNFDLYAIGKKEDIERLNRVMEADYSYGLKTDFVKSLGIFDKDDWTFTTEYAFKTLKESRKQAKLLNNKKAIEMLKDENLKKEYFRNIPESGHFYRMFDYYPDEDMEKIDNNTFIARVFGTCAWSLESCVVDAEGEGYYEDGKENYPEHIFKGTTLIEFAKEVPDLKIALISQEPGNQFSEFYTFIDGELVDNMCETFVEEFYDSVEKAAKKGVFITEDEVDEYFYVEFPEWFEGNQNEIYVNEDYVFEKLGVDY